MNFEQFLTSADEGLRELGKTLLQWDYKLIRYVGPHVKIWICLNEKSLLRIRRGILGSWTLHVHLHMKRDLQIIIKDYQKMKVGDKIPKYRKNLTHKFEPVNIKRLIEMIDRFNVGARSKKNEDQI